MTVLLSLDPGGTTGASLWHYDPVQPLSLIWRTQIANGNHGFIRWWSSLSESPDEVVAEVFINDRRTPSPDLTPVKIEGALDVLFPQWIGQRNVYKAQADDLLLKRAGYWFTGQEHARDSARHAIALMKRRRHLPTIKKLWPRTEAAAA